MTTKNDLITCKEVDELFTLPISKDTRVKTRLAVRHIFKCSACQKKYNTLDSLVKKIPEK